MKSRSNAAFRGLDKADREALKKRRRRTRMTSQLVFRVDGALYERIVQRAAGEGRSMGDVLRRLIVTALDPPEARPRRRPYERD